MRKLSPHNYYFSIIMAHSDFSFNEINVRTPNVFDLTSSYNTNNNQDGPILHNQIILDDLKIVEVVPPNIFFYIETSSKKLAHLLSIPNGYAQLIAPKEYEPESHIPYPPYFYINILDAVTKSEDVTKMKDFLKKYAFKEDNSELNFQDDGTDMTLATAKRNTDMIYVKRVFKKLQRRWERDIVESLRAGYTKYKLSRYSSVKKSEPDVDEEGNEIGGMIQTQEFRNFGQTLLSPDEIWADFVKLMTDESLYNNFEKEIEIMNNGMNYGSITKYTSFSEFKNDEEKPYFHTVFIGDDTKSSIHFYSGDNFLGHRFKLLNVRYLWKYGRRASETNSAGIGGNTWNNQLEEWQKMMGYPPGHIDGEIRMNQVGNIMYEFLKHNKDIIRNDDCIQQELISKYQMAVANTYWNLYDEEVEVNGKAGQNIAHSPIFWMIIVIVLHRAFNVFFSLIKKDDTGTSGFVYKLEGIPGFLSGLKDIFKYGDEGQITIHSPYSVLSPNWSFFREIDWPKEWFIKGYTKENKKLESDPKDGPYVPHSNKEGNYISGQPDQSIYLPYDSAPDRLKNITWRKLINYASCVTIGFWFSFVENSIFEKGIRKNVFGDVGNSSKKLGIGSKIVIAMLACIIVPVFSLAIAAVGGGIVTTGGVLWVFIILLLVWCCVKFIMTVYDGFNKTVGRLNKKFLFASIFGIGIGLTLLILNTEGILLISQLEIPQNIQKIIFLIISGIILYVSAILLGFSIAYYKKRPPESRIYKGFETLLSSPILEDYLKKETEGKGFIKTKRCSMFGGLVMGLGLILALIKMVPLTLYLFLWGSAPMKGGPGSDNVSELIDNFGIFTMLVVFGLLVWITYRLFSKTEEGRIKVRENAIISAMPHMGYKIPRFKYEALFVGYKSKITETEYKERLEQKINEIEGEEKERKKFEMNDGTRRKYTYLDNIYKNKGNKVDDWKKYSSDYYYLTAKLRDFKDKRDNPQNFINCLDEENYETKPPPLGMLGMTIFVFAAQMAITQINTSLPDNSLDGIKSKKDKAVEALVNTAKSAGKVKLRILLIIAITVCVILIWIIEYLPQLLIVMEKNMESKEDKALDEIRNWNRNNQNISNFQECPVDLKKYRETCDSKLIKKVDDILNADKLVVPKIKWEVFGVLIGVVAVLLILIIVWYMKS